MFGRRLALPVIFLFMTFNDAHYCSAEEQMPQGVNYLGVGYNYIDGNPEGSVGEGGVDPGLLPDRRVFAFTMNGKLSEDSHYEIPDEVYFLPNSSQPLIWHTTFHSTKSYQDKLSPFVSNSHHGDPEYGFVFHQVKFAASTRYEQVKDRISSQSPVFFAEETIQYLGHARYLTELALASEYRLDDGFVVDACSLPTTYDEARYMEFLNTWGTNVVTELYLGIREGENYESERLPMIEMAFKEVDISVSAGGSLDGYSSSIFIDMNTFNSARDSEMKLGSSFSSYKVGSETLNEPISFKLISMYDVFADDFWTKFSDYVEAGSCTDSFLRENVMANIGTAMKGYAEYRQTLPSEGSSMAIPLTWPPGQYGLPKPRDGCPDTWDTGSRYHDTDSHPENEWSSQLHLQGTRDIGHMDNHFCMKTTPGEQSGWTWQPGSYCLYKYGDKCPADFEESFIFWDDENGRNGNREDGVLPSGTYTTVNSKIYFCCRNDGVTDKPIFLPTDDSFFLFPRHENNCQKVHGMTVTNEFFQWGNEGNDDGGSQSEVHPPMGVISGSGVRLNFCYYTPTIGWPDGTYGIPKPITGCPTGDDWVEGARYQDTSNNGTNYYSPVHLAGSLTEDDIEQQFCIKSVSNEQPQRDWPEGSYCIYKYGECPTGFEAGWIKWDDDNDNNKNSKSGILPDGVYDSDTKIEFCCRNDSASYIAIDLVQADYFYLFAFDNCPWVNGLWLTSDLIMWSSYMNDNTTVDQSPFHPGPGILDHYWIYLYFCYYHREQTPPSQAGNF